MMKIAIYQPWIYTKGGIERVILEILKRGKEDYKVFTHFFDPNATFKELRNYDIENLGKSKEIRGFLKRAVEFGIKIPFTKIEELEEFDALLVSTAGWGELILLRNSKIPTFCYCHTPLRIAHDKAYFHEIVKGKSIIYKGITFAAAKAYSLAEKPLWKRFVKIFANSQNTKKRLINSKLAKKEKIKVLNPGVDAKLFKPKHKFEKFFFVPGRISKYKRQLLAIKAFIQFSKKIKGFELIIAGSVSSKDRAYFEFLKKYKNDSIKIIANPTDKEYLNYFHNCYAVLFTAVNEDWGLIPLEANAAGKLVIAANEGGPKESIKNGINGFLVPPNARAFAKKMEFLAKNENFVRKREMVCRKEALKYDWNGFVKKLEKEIKNAINK